MSVSSPAAVSDLLAAPTSPARLAHLRAEGLADETGLDWLLDRVQELVHDEPGMADELAELCEAAAAGLSLRGVAARSCYLRGRVYAERGEFDRALAFIDRARREWYAAGSHLHALRSDLGRIQILCDLGRHAEAAGVGEALLGALDALGGEDAASGPARPLRAMALNNLGATYSLVGDHERALDTYARAEAAYLALGLREATAQPLANRGICLLALGRPRDALRVLGAAAEIFTEFGDRLWSAKCAGTIARAHQQLGELVDALRVLDPARATLDQLAAHAEAARLQLATAEVYLAAGLFSEARVAAEGAAERTLAQGMVHDHAVATFTLALAHLGAAGFDAASRELDRAAGLFDRVGDRQHRARVMLAQAELADQRGQRIEALARADEAAGELRAGGWLIPLAWAQLRQADLAPAARTAAQLEGAADLIGQLNLPELRYAYQLRLARLHRRDGHPEQAEALLRRAIRAAEELGSRLPDPTLRAAYRAGKLDAHDELLDLLVARGHPGDLAEACRIGDRGKAQTLIELAGATVGRRRPGAGAGVPGALLDRRCADLSAVYAAMATAEQPVQPALRRRAAELEQELSALRLRRALEAPEESAAPATSPGDLPDAPTLAYHVAGETLTAFVLHGGKVTARRLSGVLPAVATELDRLSAQWSRFQVGAAFARRHEASLLSTTKDTLGALYRLLIAPVGDLLAGSDHASLRVIPHRSLHRVPFHALHDGTRYLGEQRTITLMPSITRVRPSAGPHPRPEHGGSGALVFAVPDAQAPSIAAEAAALARVMPEARVVLGPEATSQRLRAELPGPALLHLACHGLYRPANPLFSALRLADRWVHAAEILDLDLGGALVTLSACESGRRPQDSAEPVGLAWAFLAAGASGVVVSQWLVDDDATASLMSAMYANLAAGLAPAEALRQAQLAVAASTPHPYRWAPFVYVASPSADLAGGPP